MNAPAWTKWPTPDAGTDLFDWQAGRCAWCGYPSPLVRDHCHRIGLVRGYLCHGCNLAEGRASGIEWEKWRAGHNPANAVGEYEVYVDQFGATPITSQGALHWYSHAERVAWFALVVDYMNDGGEWPEDAPWIETAIARRSDANREVSAALRGIFRRAS